MNTEQPLTAKQRRFVDEYLVDLNATQAAIRAGYSKRTATAIGYENLRKPHLAAAIQAGVGKLMRTAEITAQEVISELTRLSRARLDDVARWSEDGLRLIPSGELEIEGLTSVKSIKSTKTTGEDWEKTTLEVRQHDKLRALALLAKYFGLLTDRVEHSGTVEHRHEITEIRVHEPSSNGNSPSRNGATPVNRVARTNGK